jgi:hypothetical protein
VTQTFGFPSDLAQITYQLQVDGRHPMWTLYQWPDDAPCKYVARLFVCLPEVSATTLALQSDTPDMIREMLSDMGLRRLERLPEDEPQILETWV